MKSKNDFMNICEQESKKLFEGKTIVKVRYMTDDEAKILGWKEKPLVFFLSDGTAFYSSVDPEGNSAGSIFTNNKKLTTIPSY